MLGERLTSALRSMFSKPERAPQTIWALRDLSLDIHTGEIVGLIGRNGAGKSTLLKILSRITRPTSGTMTVRGTVASLLEVGTGFHEELTGRENVYLCGSILGMPKTRIEARLDSIVSFAGVEQFLDTPIKHYSTGMRLRLGFAVAAHLESEILLVDEVLAVGDGDFQRKCLRAMGEMHQGGRTVVFVSHNLAAIENLCSRVIWIDQGQLRDDGNPREVIRAYMDTFAEGQNRSFDLRNFPARRGSGDILFTQLEFLDPSGQALSHVATGDPLVIRLHFHARTTIQNPLFGLDIHSQYGSHLAQLSTYVEGFDIPMVPQGPGSIDLTIAELNLMPGQYYISLGVGLFGNVVHDILSYCATLDVLPSPTLGLKRRTHGSPVIWIPVQWQLSSQSTPVCCDQ